MLMKFQAQESHKNRLGIARDEYQQLEHKLKCGYFSVAIMISLVLLVPPAALWKNKVSTN